MMRISLFAALMQPTAGGGGPPPTEEINIWGALTPTQADAIDASSDDILTLGCLFTLDVPGMAIGARYWRAASASGDAFATLWDGDDGTELVEKQFPIVGSGWQNVTFDTPYALAAASNYIISCSIRNPFAYARTPGYFAAPVVSGHFTIATGLYAYNSGFIPTLPFNPSTANYFADIIVEI
jgi:hypothetical protein